MPSIRSNDDYEHCLLEILRAIGGRGSQGQVFREFERRYTSSIPRDEAAATGEGGPPRWQRGLEEAAARLIARRRVYAPDPERWDLP